MTIPVAREAVDAVFCSKVHDNLATLATAGEVICGGGRR